MRLFIGLVFLTALQAQRPSASMTPKHYAPGQYRLVKEGATVRLYLPNSSVPLTLTMAAPNMYVSGTGVIYSEVPGGLYEMSMGVDSKAVTDAAAAAEKERVENVRRREEALDHPAGAVPDPSPVQLLAVSVSRSYPVYDFGPAPTFGSNIRAVVDFNGRQIPVWGLNEAMGIKSTDINGHPQWYRSQQGLGANYERLEDTGIYGIKPDGDGWRVEKYDTLPGDVQTVPLPTTITGDALGHPYPQPQ